MIGLIAATAQESATLLRVLPARGEVVVGAHRGWRLQAAGQEECLLLTSGVGTRRALAAARALVTGFAPRALISFGIAGAVEDDLRIGDVILVESVCALEDGQPGPQQALARWPPAAWDAAAAALVWHEARLFTGTAITTPGTQIGSEQAVGLQHPVLEMETAAVAQAAAEASIPCYALRAVSDNPAEPLPFDLAALMDEDANLRPARLLVEVLRNPGALRRYPRFASNARAAAATAAVALAAALSCLP